MTSKRPQRKRVLVVEDSFLMAEMICDCLADYGMEPVGPAATFEKALMLIKGGNVDAALLDIRLLDGEPVFSVCEPLTAQHIPFAFVSGMVEELPESFRGIPLLYKPFHRDAILRILKTLLRQSNDDLH